MRRALYNEFEPYAAEWLGNLIAAGHIADGDVDGRSIKSLVAADVAGYERAHFFAGIGVWDYALKLAGWPEGEPVWTGSCPCQPFAISGQRRGFDDPRHLWPEWFRLIRECRPSIIFGEQVASPDGLAWLDLVSADVEGEGYAFGASDLCAAGRRAPHIRQRLWFVAIADPGRREGRGVHVRERGSLGAITEALRGGAVDGVADTEGRRWDAGRSGETRDGRDASRVESVRLREAEFVGDADVSRPQGRSERGNRTDERIARAPGLDFWTPCDWIACTDGKHRPVEPGTRPLAHGAAGGVGRVRSNRAHRLRGYGNAIVPQVAATFIRAVMDVMGMEAA